MHTLFLEQFFLSFYYTQAYYLYLSGAHRMVAQPTPALIHLPQHPQRISLPPATLDPWVEYWYESWHVFEVALHTVANCVCSSVGAGSPS